MGENLSYSRWLNSCWYTFWPVSESNNKDEQIFEICDIDSNLRFTYRELKTNIDFCIETVKIKYEKLCFRNSDYEELKEYMEQFIEDVEKYTTLS